MSSVSRPTRVCFVSIPAYHVFNTASTTPTGGSEFVLLETIPHFSSDYDISVVTGDFGQEPVTTIGNTTFYSSIKFNASSLANFFSLWRALKRADADIYVKSVFGKDMFPVWLFCKMYGKKFIYLTSSDNECNGLNIRNAPFLGRLFEFALERSDSIIASVAYHKELLELYHPTIQCDITHIPHGITIQSDTTPTERNHILWLARCEEWKNPHLLLEVANRFPEEKFVMVLAPQGYTMDLFAHIQEEATKRPNITFIPGIPHAHTSKLFAEAKLSLNTSDFEGLSMAFIQSGIVGTPIVTLNLNPDSIITTHNIGYFAEGDFEQMIDAIERLLTNPQEWEEKSRNIMQYMKDNHETSKLISQWEHLFAKVLEQDATERSRR